MKETMMKCIPAELRALPHWVTWKLEQTADGKLTKIPYSKPGVKASSTDRTTWNDFEPVSVAPVSNESGIGFVFDGTGIVGIDIDHCIVNGVVDDKYTPLLNGLPSYTEISPSGTGLHIYVESIGGEPYETGRRKDSVEVYSHGRYFTVTGNRYKDSPCTVNKFAPEQIRDVLDQFLGTPTPTYVATHRESTTPSMEDSEIINIATNAANGSKFSDLMRGNTGAYGGDSSKADMALASMLAFYTTDAYQIESIMRSSGLARKKWDEHKTYLREMTINKAINMCSEHFESNLKELAEEGRLIYEGLKPVLPIVTTILSSNKSDADPEFDITKVSKGNIIRDYVEHLSSIQDAYPEYHLANIMTMLSFVCPSNINTSFGKTWNNAWFLVLGIAGVSGKSTSIGPLQECHDKIIEGDLLKVNAIPSKVTPERLVSMLCENPTRLWIIDEASGLMKLVKRDYATENVEHILKIYSHSKVDASTQIKKNASGEVIGGGDRICNSPHVGMIWYTTPEAFARNSDTEMVLNGLYMRPMFITPKRTKTPMEDREITEEEHQRFQNVMSEIVDLYCTTHDAYTRFTLNPILASWKFEARKTASSDNTMNSVKGGGLTRSFEHAYKLAQLLTIGSEEFRREAKENAKLETDKQTACKRDGVEYVRTTYNYTIPDWAAKLAIEWSGYFYSNYQKAVSIVATNNGDPISKVITKLTTEGGWVTLTELQRVSGKSGRQWKELIQDLEQEGIVEHAESPRTEGFGRKCNMYRLIKDS